MIRKIIAFAIPAFFSFASIADASSFLFGDQTNQFGLYGGYSSGNTKPEPAGGFTMIQYSQPVSFFRLQSRMNIHAGLAANKENQWLFGGWSLDAILLYWNKFYLGAGIGAFMRTHQTERLSSRFTFGERAFIGYKITDSVGAELYAQHFSNGDLTDKNFGYNFAGLGLLYKF